MYSYKNQDDLRASVLYYHDECGVSYRHIAASCGISESLLNKFKCGSLDLARKSFDKVSDYFCLLDNDMRYQI